jgi:BASS family bile acid:Na+ symporter
MFGLGITLTLGDFKRIFQYPKALIIGLICQMIFLPLVAWLIITILPLDPVYAVGVLIVALCPGGATSNFLSHMFKGNVPLSISLTVTNSLISIITIPFLVNLSLV